MIINQSQVFISYAWGGESEKIVNELEAPSQNLGLTIVRDKRDLGFKGLITDFMRKIGAGKAVVMVISDKYLKSPYCMFELMEIYRNRDFTERIFPIVLDDATIFDPITRLAYLGYWREKKSELERAIEAFGAEAITVVGDDYKIYHKIFSNFGEVINILKDINALTPQIHRSSNFQQLYQALLQRLDEDSKYTRQKDTEKLLKQLSTGSQQYYKELTGNNGPYHHLNISEAILGGISHADISDKRAKIILNTTVKIKNDDEFPLENSLQQLWHHEKPHLLLLGDGGMGKTVSLIHFWETLLKNNQENKQETIPIFITLHEYNTVSEGERPDFIAKRIIWNYLGIKESRGEAMDVLWDVFKTASKKGMPNIVLLLDGFNEVTADPAQKRHLLLELQELRQKGKAVQMVLSSRYEMNFTWAEGFQTVELRPLDEENVKTYLQAQRVNYPEDQRLRQILQNPMMLTLYANANEIIEKYKLDKQFEFKPYTTTQGELLWNYLEAQIVKLAKIYGREAADFYYYKFMIRHFLPYLGFEMEQAGQFIFEQNQLLQIISECCRHFYQREFIQVYPEYRSCLKDLNPKDPDFVEEAERFEQISKALCNDLRLMKREKKVYEFLHQNFRDYFAAVHLLNELGQTVVNQNIPLILTSRPLPIYIRRFAGQIAGEQYQTETPSPPPTLLMHTLDNLRGVFDEEKTGYAVWNIVNTWKESRSHLGGANLSDLNLLKIGLQDVFCYQSNGSLYNSSRFDKSLISEKYFLPQGHNDTVNSVAFHPDGKTFISGSADNAIKVWDLKTAECLASFEGNGGIVSCVAFHPDGKTFLSGSGETIKTWDMRTGECLNSFEGHRDSVYSVAFHPDGKTFISGSGDNIIKVWDLSTGECLASLEGHSGFVLSVSIHHDGKTLISASSDYTIKTWDLNKGECLANFEGHSDYVSSVAFHPDGKTFISSSWDNTIKAWNLKTGECLASFEGHNDMVSCVAFHLDGKTFISGSADKAIKVWDLKTGECLATFEGHSGFVQSVAFHPDGKTFISASEDTTIKAWDLKTGECLTSFEGHNDIVLTAAFHPDGKTFISGLGDTIKSWDLMTGKCLVNFKGHSENVSCVAFHPDGKTFISCSQDNTVRIWNLKTGECLASFEVHSNNLSKVAFHPDGKTFIFGSGDTIKAWNLKTGECVASFEGHDSYISSIAFHPDGKTFISGSRDSIKVWDLMTGECLNSFEVDSSNVGVTFHPDGKTFISGSWYNTIKIWDVKTGECLASFQGRIDNVSSIALNSDGRTIITASEDDIEAWDLKTGECLASFEGHSDSVESVAFHPDGKTFISCSRDNTIKAWDLKTGECLLTITSVSGLLLAGCSFMNLHPNSQLSAKAKNIMRQFGAIFDEEDKKRWDEAVQRFYNSKLNVE
ncbi:MAG: TIR domain-containing protein [Chitinophagaceae bacterium]